MKTKLICIARLPLGFVIFFAFSIRASESVHKIFDISRFNSLYNLACALARNAHGFDVHKTCTCKTRNVPRCTSTVRMVKAKLQLVCWNSFTVRTRALIGGSAYLYICVALISFEIKLIKTTNFKRN